MATNSRNAVLDTNVVISRMLHRTGISALAYDRIHSECTLLASRETFAELRLAAMRDKFARYLPIAVRLAFVELYTTVVETVAVTESVTECRDPKDNKFLELALCGKADVIVTGDDLLCLHPWRGIAILRPAEYLDRMSGTG